MADHLDISVAVCVVQGRAELVGGRPVPPYHGRKGLAHDGIPDTDVPPYTGCLDILSGRPEPAGGPGGPAGPGILGPGPDDGLGVFPGPGDLFSRTLIGRLGGDGAARITVFGQTVAGELDMADTARLGLGILGPGLGAAVHAGLGQRMTGERLATGAAILGSGIGGPGLGTAFLAGPGQGMAGERLAAYAAILGSGILVLGLFLPGDDDRAAGPARQGQGMAGEFLVTDGAYLGPRVLGLGLDPALFHDVPAWYAILGRPIALVFPAAFLAQHDGQVHPRTSRPITRSMTCPKAHVLHRRCSRYSAASCSPASSSGRNSTSRWHPRQVNRMTSPMVIRRILRIRRVIRRTPPYPRRTSGSNKASYRGRLGP
ncbi:MAG: hypothetical protein MPJ25_00360 [Pirellulales bacterium]|nr:hypothetical protein [Pirellulales bacterium]